MKGIQISKQILTALLCLIALSCAVLPVMDDPAVVETAAQARVLQSQGSTQMQGFYFYKPMPMEEFEKLIENAETAAWKE